MLEINKIYNEDCIGENGMCLIPDKSIDMILCDLPYGTTQCKWDSIIPLNKLWKEYERIIKNEGAIILFGVEPFTSELIHSNLNLFKYKWTWNKSRVTNHLNARKQPLRVVEDISVFYNKQCTYNPILRDKEKKNIRDTKNSYSTKNNHTVGKEKENYEYNEGREIPINKGYPIDLINIIQVGTNKGERIHPTQKPVTLFEYLINTYTNEGDLILDNCIGSGTTSIAAINTNRNYIGFELDKTFFDLANQRIEKHNSI